MSDLLPPSGFHLNVPILLCDWSKYEEEKSFGQDVNCSWATNILLASKGKGHKPAKMVCVQWLL
jgi:hypothetical protein